jgi:triphosphoribosyl-dephospho-CoA synthase
MQRVFLEFLARFPDSHIARKHGASAAQAISHDAQVQLRRVRADAVAAQADLAAWDARLKADGMNPGTSADLAVATAFLADMVCSPFIHAHSGSGWRYA